MGASNHEIDPRASGEEGGEEEGDGALLRVLDSRPSLLAIRTSFSDLLKCLISAAQCTRLDWGERPDAVRPIEACVSPLCFLMFDLRVLS